MSIVIFFGFALLVFLAGLTVLSLTFYHWYKQARERKLQIKAQETTLN